MEKCLTKIIECLPTILSNTKFEIKLEGWPAATTVVAICVTAVVWKSVDFDDSQANDIM